MIVQTPLAWYRHLNNKMSRLTSFMGHTPPFLVKTFDLYYVKLKAILINYLLNVKFNERKKQYTGDTLFRNKLSEPIVLGAVVVVIIWWLD
jgi:hypothetical protein